MLRKNIFIIMLAVCIFISTLNTIYAADGDWWGQANGFLSGFKGGSTEIGDSTVDDITGGFLNSMTEFVRDIGNLIFFIVTAILGVKYIWGSVESKTTVKEGMFPLVIAAMFFYGWSGISILIKGGWANTQLGFIKGDYQSTISTIYSIVMYIVNFLTVGGIVYIGIRYMMAGAEGKAQLKAKGLPIILGIIMVYSTATFLGTITKILTELNI